ncbi:MAG TPA: polysaccharide biosynthesis C-terminal domain-containing protein [Chitinophagaceae bacterium]|nr:polysaccharide biosynthesis C-terminal domain-containing protein [Chitinophagaceae bacterium]
MFRKNIIINHSTQVISTISNLLCMIMTARILGTFGQGDLALYNTFIAVVLLISGLGIPSAFVYFLASKKMNVQKAIPIMFSVTLVSFSILILFYILGGYLQFIQVFLPHFIQSNYTWTFVMFMQLSMMSMNQYLQSILIAENKFSKSGYITIIGSLALLFLYSLKFFNFVSSNIEPLFWVVGSMLLVAMIQYIFYFIHIRNTNPFYLKFLSISFNDVKPMIAFSALTYMANIIQFLNYKMDIWFLNYFQNDSNLIGIYSLGVSLAQLVWLLPNAVQAVLYTYVSSNENAMQDKVSKTKRVSNWALLYALIVGIGGYLISIYLIPILFGEAFSRSIQIIKILIIGIIPFVYSFGISAYFAGIKKIEFNLYGSLIGFVVCLILNAILIPKYSIEGAAWSSVVSYIITVLFITYKFNTYKKLSN